MGTDDVRTDGALVVAARRGSTRAFGELYRVHAGWVAQMVRARASPREHVVADIVQEVFTRALENLDRLRDPARFRGWVRSIADHVIADHHRAAARSQPLEDDAAEDVPAPDVPPDAAAEAAEMARLVRTAVGGLSARDATAITLVGSLGLSPAEVGRVLGVSRGTAKVVVHRARHRLRSALRMQVLLERRLSRCPRLWQLAGEGRTVAAARHVERCEECRAPDVDGPGGSGDVAAYTAARASV